ncbi:MAG: hypothetical protein AB7S26_01995 [Sandaracinaceae bacterium]
MDLPPIVAIGVWSVFAGAVVLRLRRAGPQTFDGSLTPEDRRLVGASAFYLAAPSLVLLAHAATAVAMRVAGQRVSGYEPWVYWGSFDAPVHAPALTRVALASIGPLLEIAIAVGLLLSVRLAPSRAASNFFRLELARVLGTLVLAVQPVASVLARRGDFHVLRSALSEWRAPYGDVALLVYGCVAAYAWWWWRNARRLRSTGTLHYDAERIALRRLALDPEDADAACLLAAARLALDHPDTMTTLERAAELAPEDPRLPFLHGQAYLHRGEALAASDQLRRAGQLVEAQEHEDRSLRFEIELALSAARIALGDAEGAVLTARSARETRPSDPRGLLILVDALVAMGRREEATHALENAHEGASGAAKREIERRLTALRRRK